MTKMTMRNELIHYLKEQANHDVNDFPAFKASLWFRNYLLSVPVPVDIANRLAIEIKFEIDEIWSDDEIKEVVEPFACVVANLVNAYLKHGFSKEDIYTIGNKMSLEF